MSFVDAIPGDVPGPREPAEQAPRSVRVPGSRLASRRRADGGRPQRDDHEVVSRPSSRGRGPSLGPDQERGELASPAWSVLTPETGVHLDARRLTRQACVRQLLGLSPGSWVSVVDDRPLSRIRLRRLARCGGLVVVHELIVLPTPERPVLIVDEPVPGRHRQPGHRSVVAAPGWRTAVVLSLLGWSWGRWLLRPRVMVAQRV